MLQLNPMAIIQGAASLMVAINLNEAIREYLTLKHEIPSMESVMWRLVFALAMVVFIFAIYACGGDVIQETPDDDAVVRSTDKKISMAYPF